MNDEYEEYKDFKEERKRWYSVIGPKTKVVIALIVLGFFYVMYSSNADYKDYIIPVLALGVALGGLIYMLGKGNPTSSIEYINWKTAKDILLQGLKDYNELRRKGICKIELPKGDIKLGMYSRIQNKRIYDPQMYLYWEYGFIIEDEDDNNTQKYFLAKIDAKMGGEGVISINKLKERYNGEPSIQFIEKPIVVSSERYLEEKRGSYRS